jgi:hypothetical protein
VTRFCKEDILFMHYEIMSFYFDFTDQDQFPLWNNFDVLLLEIGVQSRLCK